MSILAIGGAIAGIVINSARSDLLGETLKTFLVAALAGFTTTLVIRAVTWRLRGE